MNHKERDQFWGEVALKEIDWFIPWTSVCSGDFIQGNISWFNNAQLNVSYNCLDRHLSTHAHHPAIIWEGDEEHEHQVLSFAELHAEVCRMANVLKHLGVKKGDTVGIYLPMIPQAAIAMLACTRIGAIHSVVFAGFSAHALRQRLIALQCKILITADAYSRGGKRYALKKHSDEACHHLDIKKLIIRHFNYPLSIDKNNEFYWHEEREKVSAECPAESMDAEAPLFILYTSGSTGQPKGVVHSTGGYLVQTSYSFRHVFQCSKEDVFWCTADVGWITGHSYLIYGPLAHGVTTLMFAGIPTWPKPDRFWKIVDKYQVNVLYTAPTAIRSLKRAGDEWLADSSRASLRLLGSVGEPINPEVWEWYFKQVGQGRCPIIDTWWQTETGAIMLSPPLTQKNPKPGAACQPLPGIFPVLLDDADKEINGLCEGRLAIKEPWPSMARTVYKDHERYLKTYFSHGYYITGDGAKRDEDGDYWLLGRIDDVLNVAGHRLGTAEIENASLLHPAVAEAAALGIPHPLKGEGIVIFLTVKEHAILEADFNEQISRIIMQEISAIAKPEAIIVVPNLPKTRSGKIMRRILRLIACRQATTLEDFGDLSTLAEADVVRDLLKLVSENK